jgi:hypothetical protein
MQHDSCSMGNTHTHARTHTFAARPNEPCHLSLPARPACPPVKQHLLGLLARVWRYGVDHAAPGLPPALVQQRQVPCGGCVCMRARWSTCAVIAVCVCVRARTCVCVCVCARRHEQSSRACICPARTRSPSHHDTPPQRRSVVASTAGASSAPFAAAAAAPAASSVNTMSRGLTSTSGSPPSCGAHARHAASGAGSGQRQLRVGCAARGTARTTPGRTRQPNNPMHPCTCHVWECAAAQNRTCASIHDSSAGLSSRQLTPRGPASVCRVAASRDAPAAAVC